MCLQVVDDVRWGNGVIRGYKHRRSLTTDMSKVEHWSERDRKDALERAAGRIVTGALPKWYIQNPHGEELNTALQNLLKEIDDDMLPNRLKMVIAIIKEHEKRPNHKLCEITTLQEDLTCLCSKGRYQHTVMNPHFDACRHVRK